MEIFGVGEDDATKSFGAPVEIIDDVFGKFVCRNCHGDGWLDCATGNGEEKCALCKGVGFLLVGW